MNHLLAIGAVLFGAHSLAYAANESTLPKGQRPNVRHMVSAPKPKEAKPSCLNYFAKPLGSSGFFDLKGEFFYHASRKKKLNQSGKSTYAYEVHQLNLNNFQVVKLANSKLTEVDALFTHGGTPDGLSLVVFSDNALNCKSGLASHLTISLKNGNQKSPRVLKGEGDFEITESDKDMLVYQKKKNSYLEHDFQGFQTRFSPAELRVNERPLFVDRARRLQYVFKLPKDSKDKNFGLIAYKNNKTVATSLKLMESQKVLQQKNLFGVAELNEKNNQIIIKEVGPWSGKSQEKDYLVQVPKTFKIKDAELDVNFLYQKFMVSALGMKMKKRWRSIFLYDYAKHKKPIGVFTPRKGKYVSYSGISSTGKEAVVVTANLKTDKDENIGIFSFASKKWKIIKIP